MPRAHVIPWRTRNVKLAASSVQLFNGAVKEQRKKREAGKSQTFDKNPNGGPSRTAKQRHGHARRNHKTPTYLAWARLHDRCYNPHYHRFHRYGGRGIRVCSRWRSSNPRGFRNFLSDMGEHPGKGYSLGRLDTDWIYSPHNCYWATIKQQANHQQRPLGRTGLRGVICTTNGRYRAALYRNGKRYHLGIFATPTEASAAYQLATAPHS